MYQSKSFTCEKPLAAFPCTQTRTAGDLSPDPLPQLLFLLQCPPLASLSFPDDIQYCPSTKACFSPVLLLRHLSMCSVLLLLSLAAQPQVQSALPHLPQMPS